MRRETNMHKKVGTHLNRGGAEGKDLIAGTLGVAVEVNKDVNAIAGNHARSLAVHEPGNVLEMFHFGLNLPAPL